MYLYRAKEMIIFQLNQTLIIKEIQYINPLHTLSIVSSQSPINGLVGTVEESHQVFIQINQLKSFNYSRFKTIYKID